MKIFKNETLNRVDVLDERFYTLDNKTFYPSVTTVLSAYPKGYAFQEWLKSTGFNADIILEKAGQQGTNVHNAIENFLNKKELIWINGEGYENYTLNEWKMICRYMDFHENYVDKDKPMAVETLLFSDGMKLGGTADLVCTINGETWMIDFKTSNGLYKTYDMQLAVYKNMWDEKNEPKIERYGILWLNSSHRTIKEFQGIGWQLKEITKDHEENISLYNHTRALWDQENPNYSPKNLSFANSYKL